MKSMAAYTAQLKAENQGRTQKVQDSSRSVTTGIYQGVAGCGPQNYQQINFFRRQKCCFVNISPK
jgi:hypothetical protein